MRYCWSVSVLWLFTEQKWKHITTWYQYLVWPNSPTLSKWPRWEWIMHGGGEWVSIIVFGPSNSSHFSISDMTDCLTLPMSLFCPAWTDDRSVASLLQDQMRMKRKSICAFSFHYYQLVWEEVNVDRFFPVLYPKVRNPYTTQYSINQFCQCVTYLYQSDNAECTNALPLINCPNESVALGNKLVWVYFNLSRVCSVDRAEPWGHLSC